MRRVIVSFVVFGSILSVAVAEPPRTGPLATLPSTPGDHLARIKALNAGDWLELGAPEADPKWAKAFAGTRDRLASESKAWVVEAAADDTDFLLHITADR